MSTEDEMLDEIRDLNADLDELRDQLEEKQEELVDMTEQYDDLCSAIRELWEKV